MKPDMLILVAGRAVQAILTIALFRLLTSFLSPAEAGGVYLIISIATFFGMFALNPVFMYLNRKLFLWHDSKSISEHLLGYNLYSIIVSLLAVPIVYAVWLFFGIGADMPGLLFALLVACYTYALSCNQVFLPFLNALGHRVSFMLLTLATTGLGLVFSAAFAHFWSPTAAAWMAGQAAAIGLVTLLGGFVFLKKIPEPGARSGWLSRYANKAVLSNVAGFAVPLAGAAFFMWAQGQSYRVVVTKVNGLEFLGYLAVGFSIATSVAGILESLVQQLYLPGFYKQISGGDAGARRSALTELTSKTIPVYIIYLFFLAGSSEYLVSFLVSEKYRSVFVYARYGAVIEFFRMTTNILASGAHSEMRTKALIKPYFFGGAAAVAGVYFAALSPDPSVFIPLALAGSGLVTLSFMWYVINSMVSLSLDFKTLARYSLLGTLFLPLAFFHPAGPFLSAGVLALSGLYFSFLQYRAAGEWRGDQPSPSPGPDRNYDMTGTDDLVTVAIPTRNRIPGLVKALASVTGQTCKNLEIIISDNNSGGDVAGALAAIKDDRIKYFGHSKDLSMTENWSFCLEQARGKYFLLLSDDDCLVPEAIDTLARAFLHGKTALAYGRALFRSEEGEFLGLSRNAPARETGEEFIHASLSGRRHCLPSCTMFRTEAARLLGGYPETGNSTDLALNLSLAASGAVSFHSAPLMEYAIHPGGLSANPAKTQEGFLKLAAWAANPSSPVAKWKEKIAGFCASSLRAWARSSALRGDRDACRSFIDAAATITGKRFSDKLLFPLLLAAPVRYLFNCRRSVKRMFKRAEEDKFLNEKNR